MSTRTQGLVYCFFRLWLSDGDTNKAFRAIVRFPLSCIRHIIRFVIVEATILSFKPRPLLVVHPFDSTVSINSFPACRPLHLLLQIIPPTPDNIILIERLVLGTHLDMTTQTRIQLKLQRDSGSIFYQDKDDNLAFHIEAMRSTPPSPSADERTQSEQGGRAATPDHEEESAATTDLVKSFLRQHLLKNGERSRCLIPMMKRDGMEALLIATVVLHLRKDGQGEGEGGGVRDDGAAIRSLHKTLGSLVSMLQQRERVLKYLEENPDVVSGDDAKTESEEE